MKYNQLSYFAVSENIAEQELRSLGFNVNSNKSFKLNFKTFLNKILSLHYQDTDYALSMWIADTETDLLSFFQSDKEVTANIFNTVALQVLGFIPNVDFKDTTEFIEKLHFPIIFDSSLGNLHQLLATRCPSGNTLIDRLVTENLIPVTNDYAFFNGKSLATFDTSNVIREVVYVETPVDTDGDGQTDIIKVNIIRPKTTHKIPVIMTASPYQQGVNEPASDALTHKMEGELTVKSASAISLREEKIQTLDSQSQATLVTETEESFTNLPRPSYTLNDYMLARGFANIYVSGIGTLNSDGFMTTGDYQQVEAYKSVIDWLNGRAVAFTSKTRERRIEAIWATGKVVTSGLSYLGTMSNALATTGVDGLDVIIAEAGISSWYDYYRENGLIVSPGGYPGEDLNSLTELTYSRNLLAGDYLRNNATYQKFLEQQGIDIDRVNGDYNQFWHNRNYIKNADKVKATVVFTHGTQDWNVKPINVFNMFNALPNHIDKHLFLHHGAHVYINNWQSIDFRESMNTLLSQKLLGQENNHNLPVVIWQDNRSAQTWKTLETFGSQNYETFDLSSEGHIISNHYNDDSFTKYGKNFNNFKADLFTKKANAITIDIPVEKALLLNGRVKLTLSVKSSTNKGLLSAQLLEQGEKKYLQDIPSIISPKSLDNGRLFEKEHLVELPQREAAYRVITKGHLNLQNRDGLLTIKEVIPDDWMQVTLELQPTIYALEENSTLRLVLYTTDFEHTIRDNSDYELTIDWNKAQLALSVTK
ncbi:MULTISPECIES: Xaa-Pro dipeptidyl-peptidase [Streptococcus]|uniref:Xaa-Pro dipeptidyl-peptidase n=1 Tax=Streptococcus caledonicus TaxID=2614158 RepID=A0ABW0UBV3_9STRE|nr:Xaa-Pro dipeptidyl-peptidase [Streptococcus sp. S784/96/1]